MWFHLSNNDRDIPNPIEELRPPGFEYLDVEEGQRLLCVAPTVWQCLLSISARKDDTRFIYRIDVTNPIPADSDNENIADADLTAEARITPEVLAANGGSICTELIGTLQVPHDQILCVKIASRHKGVRPNAQQECLVFWDVDENGLWTLRNCGADLESDCGELMQN